MELHNPSLMRQGLSDQFLDFSEAETYLYDINLIPTAHFDYFISTDNIKIAILGSLVEHTTVQIDCSTLMTPIGASML